MDGWSLHFTVHPSISLSAKIHLDVMIEEGAERNLRPNLWQRLVEIKCHTVKNVMVRGFTCLTLKSFKVTLNDFETDCPPVI